MCRPACSLDSQACLQAAYPRGASTHEQMPGASERGGAGGSGQSVESSVRPFLWSLFLPLASVAGNVRSEGREEGLGRRASGDGR